jgi:hypothetical protein
MLNGNPRRMCDMKTAAQADTAAKQFAVRFNDRIRSEWGGRSVADATGPIRACGR